MHSVPLAHTQAPHLVLVGPMGAGKSSIGKRLAERLGLPFVDADRALEERTGASIAQIFDCEGEAGFRQRESRLLAELLASPRQLIATGGGVVLSAENRAQLAAHAFVVHLDVDVAGQLHRLRYCRSRPLLQRPDREQVLTQMALTRTPLYAQVAHLHFDTEGHSPEEAVQLLLAVLQTHGFTPDEYRDR
ncbi:shikimate kinase [Lysobacteraceae bacterium NML08-0793]|nr:shikimate kinase [Xanthomonadaceae bacterium NML08-0793]